MRPLKLLLAAPLLLPVAADRSVAGCAAHKPFKTKVVVNVNLPETTYNYRMSTKQLTAGQKDVTKKWQSEQVDHVWASADLHVNGVAEGGMSVNQQASFIGKPYDRYGMYYCPYVRTITINVYYNTRIFIGSEIPQGSCEFFAVLAHEHKHRDTNVAVVKDVTERLKKDLPLIISELEGRYVKRAEVDGGFQNLNAGLTDMFKIYSSYMSEQMTERNNLIDTPEEYARVAHECVKR